MVGSFRVKFRKGVKFLIIFDKNFYEKLQIDNFHRAKKGKKIRVLVKICPKKVCTLTNAARPGYVAPSIIQSHRSVRQNPTAEALTDSQPGIFTKNYIKN